MYILAEEEIYTEVLQYNYNKFLMRHFKYKHTFKLLKCKYYWFKIIKDVNYYMRICSTYAHVKTAQNIKYKELQFLS